MKSRYKSLLVQALKRFFNALGYELHKTDKDTKTFVDRSFLEGVLEVFFLAGTRINFLQVGANDGATNDPIHRFIMSHPRVGGVVLVEPQQELHEKLRANYHSHDNVKILACAIDGESDTQKLYRIKPKYWSRYKGITGSGVSSFSKDYLLDKTKLLPRHVYSTAEEAIEAIEVPCCKLDDLLEHLEVNGATVLQVDTEGHDDKVIYTLNLRKKSPIIINYEYNHLSEKRLTSLHLYLRENGYGVIRWSDSDELALLISAPEDAARSLLEND